ncbi:MAG: hypothetical protein HGB08_02345 [Candidatus Moranbacteria bacterium]|nr:hypothetical protein [Candidatus Moranbacteria bacterium]
MNQYERREYVGSCCGNSFIILDCRSMEMSRQSKVDFAVENINKYGVDSALFLRPSNVFDAFMEIYEKDGSESESCGNGTLLIAYLLGLDKGKIEMKDNGAIVEGDSEKQSISMSLKFSDMKKINNDSNCVYIKVGEPHIVYLVDDLNNFDLTKFGKEMQKDYPEGVNVDAIQKIDESHYLIRTYERGLFAETKSCGTGSLSSYLAVLCFDNKSCNKPIEFKSDGGVHWVSRNGNMLKLETMKKFCEIRSL